MKIRSPEEGYNRLLEVIKTKGMVGHNHTNPNLGARRRIKGENMWAIFHHDKKQFIDKFGKVYEEKDLV